MNERDRRPHPAAVRLRGELEQLADALASVRIDALLASEARLADTLAEIARQGPDGRWDRAATACELTAARAMLTRCRRLGSALGDVTRLTLAAQGRSGYGRLPVERGVRHALEVRA